MDVTATNNGGTINLGAAANTNTVNIYTLPAGGVLHAVKAKHSIVFSGGGIVTYNLTVVVDSATNTFSLNLTMSSGVSATNGKQVFPGSATENINSQTAATQITATVTSTGAFLNAATQGSVDIWLLVSTAT